MSSAVAIIQSLCSMICGDVEPTPIDRRKCQKVAWPVSCNSVDFWDSSLLLFFPCSHPFISNMAVTGAPSAPSLRLLLCVLIALPLATLAALFPKNSPVVQLSASSFRKEVLDIEKPTLVAFTAPWCGHCQKLGPEYDGAARSLQGIVKFANIDCDVEGNKPICGRYGVQGFPTIKLFPPTKNRVPRDYQGERSGKALIDYAVAALPHSVRKLKAEELAPWISTDPSRGKVLLFSNKPTSSPLYKSLALDFRKSMSFAFARGDQAPVTNAARATLGLKIQGTNDLPVLVFFPPRADGQEEFQKGSFDTYEGKLKYDLLKTWLDDIKAKYDIQDASPEPSASKAAKKATSSASNKKKQKAKAADDDKVPPKGGAYEWKPPSKKSANEDDDSPPEGVLSKKRASQLAEDIKAQQEKLSKKAKGAAGDAEALAFGERHRVPKSDSDSPSDTDDPADGHVNEGPYNYTDSQNADVHVMNKILEESGAYQVADEALNRVGKAAENVRTGASEAYENIRKAADGVASKLSQAGGGAASDIFASEDVVAPFHRKRKALMSAFEKWLSGEQPNWESDYSKDILEATKDVERLIATDPAKAADLAWENEQWMLDQLKLDKDKMWDSLGLGKQENLQDMIDLIQQRLNTRAEGKQKNEAEGGMEAALQAVMQSRKKKDAEKREKERKLKEDNEPVVQEHPRDHHDEL